MGVRFELIVFSRSTGVDFDEKPLANENIHDYSERITREKLQLGWNAVNERKLLPSPVLVADTCIGFQDQIIGKPSNLDDAFNILSKLSGNIHNVYTTIAIQFGDSCELITTKKGYLAFPELCTFPELCSTVAWCAKGFFCTYESGIERTRCALAK